MVTEGKLRRKGSRMSMERLQRQIKVEPIPEDGNPYSMPKFLEKSNSIQSNASSVDSQTPVPRMPRGRPTEPNGDVVGEGREDNHLDNGVKNNCDEGLGESFDQQSEMSDSNSSLKGANGQNGTSKNGGSRYYDTVPEEKTSESGSLVGEGSAVAPGNSDNNAGSLSPSDISPELTLDPSKLPATEEGSVMPTDGVDNMDESPFNQKVGSIKKVSFFCGEDEGGNKEKQEPVSDTYVYEGKPRKKFGFRKTNKK